MTSAIQSFETLNKVCDTIIKHNLPKDVVLYMEPDEYKKTHEWLGGRDSCVAALSALTDTNPVLIVDRLSYGGVTFNIICL